MGASGEMALLERGAELEAVEATLATARGGLGRCLVVWGGAGLGKSSLLDAACQSALETSMTVLRARGGELERDFTFGIVVQLFQGLLVGAGTERDGLMSGAAALSEPVFAGAASPSAGAADEYALLHGLHWLAANAAEPAPLLLAVDDAHWSDASSLRWIVYLLQRLDELPIAIVVAARPAEAGPPADLVERISRHGVASELSLNALSPEAVAELLRAELDGADDELCAACAASTGGNPFYIRDFIAAVRSPGGSVVPDADPASGAVLGRLAALSEPARALASAVAVLGSDAPLERAATLADVGADAAAAAADDLAAVSILEPGARLTFVHPLIREAIYSRTPAAQRQRAHARAAELLRDSGADPEQVAVHLVESRGAAPEWSAAALGDAAARAGGRGAPAAASRYLRAAVDGPGPVVDRGALLTELAMAEAKAQEGDPVARANTALDAIVEPRERASAALEIGLALVDASKPEAEGIFARGLEALGDDGGELAMTLRASRLAVGVGHATADPGDLESIVQRAEDGVATPAERLMLSHGALGLALRGEAIDEVRRLASASLAGARLDPTSPTFVAAYSYAVTSLFMAGDFSEAVQALTAVLADARDRGAVLAFGALSHIRGHAHHRAGRIEDAIADFQSALDTVRYGWEPELPAVYAGLALCLIERGELDAAEAALQVPGGEERWGDTFTWADVIDARGRLRFARGDAAGAFDDCLACGERLKAIGASHETVVPWRSGATEAAVRLGKTELAGRLAAENVELARAWGAKREVGAALRAAAAAAGGDKGIELLREAVDVLRDSEATLELGHALADLGGALLTEGHRLAARDALAEALDLAHRCHAHALEDTARERLVATGARPRRASARGSDALTPRERRIATMASEGLGNREIAEALFITTKTVETHLGRAYRKLEISSRRELPDALTEA